MGHYALLVCRHNYNILHCLLEVVERGLVQLIKNVRTAQAGIILLKIITLKITSRYSRL